MPRAAETDALHSATPLEMRFEGVHPRLYASPYFDAAAGIGRHSPPAIHGRWI
jgi:hypothetical protein